MRRYVVTRLLQAIPVLFGVSILVFLLIHLVPGDAVEVFMGTQVAPTEEQVLELRRIFGLTDPLPVQYGKWMGRTLSGDLGVSLRSSRPVLEEILRRFPVSAELALLSLLCGILLGIPLGILSALHHGRRLDAATRVFGLLGLSMPDFWLATLLVLIFSRYVPFVQLGRYVSPAQDLLENLRIMVLPALAFGSGLAAVIMRFTRSSMLEVLRQDYVRTAQAKGLAPARVILSHVLRNALLPVITVVGFYGGYLLGGTVVIEEVFALPGMGRLTLHAIAQRDYPLVQGVVLFVSTFFILINLVVDLLYAVVNPRIRYD